MYFPVNIAKSLRAAFFEELFQWLFLDGTFCENNDVWQGPKCASACLVEMQNPWLLNIYI